MSDPLFSMRPWNLRELPKAKVTGVQRGYDLTFFATTLSCGHTDLRYVEEYPDGLPVGSVVECQKCASSEPLRAK